MLPAVHVRRGVSYVGAKVLQRSTLRGKLLWHSGRFCKVFWIFIDSINLILYRIYLYLKTQVFTPKQIWDLQTCSLFQSDISSATTLRSADCFRVSIGMVLRFPVLPLHSSLGRQKLALTLKSRGWKSEASDRQDLRVLRFPPSRIHHLIASIVVDYQILIRILHINFPNYSFLLGFQQPCHPPLK